MKLCKDLRFLSTLLFHGTLLNQYAQAQPACEQRATTASYSVCFPRNWKVGVPDSEDRVTGCNKNGICTGNGGGFPLPGVVFIFLAPAENTPTFDVPPKSIDEIVEQFKSRDGISITTIEALDIPGKKAAVSRTRFKPGKVWDEVYGVEVDSKLFRAWVQ